MLNQDFVKILRCPKTQTQLEELSQDELLKVNEKLSSQGEDSFEGALISREAKLIYPIVNNIPVLLVDEAVQA